MEYEEFASLQLDKPIPDLRVRNIAALIRLEIGVFQAIHSKTNMHP